MTRRATAAQGQADALAVRPPAALAVASRTRAAVPPELQPQADARYLAIGPLLDYHNGKGLLNPFTTVGELETYIGKQQEPPVSSRTVREWVRRFRQAQKAGANPYAALCDRVRKDEGQSRFFAAHPDAAAFVQEKYLVERLENFTLVHEALEREFDRFRCKGRCPVARRLDDGSLAPCAPPNGDTTRRYLGELSHSLKTLALRGPRTWDAKCGPNMLREKPKAGQWWVLDSRQLDIGCRNTIFDERRPNEMVRLWVTAIVDWGSGAWVGFCLSPQPSSRTIASALRMALSEYGFPANFLFDNGEDFKRIQRVLEGKDLGDGFTQLLANFLRDNGIEFGVTRALPYNARAKMIEPKFSGMSKRFDPIWGAAYQGRSTTHRNEYNQLAQKRHDKHQAGKASSTPLPADCEVIAGMAQWFENENSRQRRETDGRSPLEVLDAEYPAQARRPVGRDLLNVLFCERDRRKILQGGGVQLDRRRYQPAPGSQGALAMLQGCDVLVLRDPYSLENAVALNPRTMDFIGELELQEFVAQCPNGHLTRDQIQAHMRLRRGLLRGQSAYLAWLAALAERQGWKSEREVLLAQATGTDDAVAVAAPGARSARALPPARSAMPQLAPAFVSDAVDSLPDISNLELED